MKIQPSATGIIPALRRHFEGLAQTQSMEAIGGVNNADLSGEISTTNIVDGADAEVMSDDISAPNLLDAILPINMARRLMELRREGIDYHSGAQF